MRRIVAIISCLTFVFSGCTSSNAIQEKQKPIEKAIIFFSNEEKQTEEITYYDALIELKQQYPAEFKKMKVINPYIEKQEAEKYTATKTPALIVIYEDEMIVNMDGQRTKDEIIISIAEAIDKMNN